MILCADYYLFFSCYKCVIPPEDILSGHYTASFHTNLINDEDDRIQVFSNSDRYIATTCTDPNVSLLSK